jgi:CRP-like cAMP-binding protein
MVAPSHRGGTLYSDLGATTAAAQNERGVLLTFGASEPHLVTFYAELGMRPYADRHAFSEESGYLIPNVVFAQGVEAFGDDPPPCIRGVLRGENAVSYAHQDGEAGYLGMLRAAIAALPPDTSVFRGLTDEQLARCTERSLIIRCEVADQILKVGGTARTPFVVLSGRLEARVGDRVTCELTPGALFGESGLLGNHRRGADVVVTDPDTTILALSERVLAKIVLERPEIGSTLFANIANGMWSRMRDADLLCG